MAAIRSALCLLLVLAALAADDALGFIFSSSSSRSSSSRGGGQQPPRFSHDIGTRSGLTSLYNSRVTHAEHWERPLGSSSVMFGPFRHSGVVVTTDTGDRWLIHKGDGYGRSSQTVVTRAGHMSPRWRQVEGHDVSGSSLADYVRAGGANYGIATDNCHHGRCRMMGLP
uniref:Uncharacterized protein n=1 Tax=Pectinaria gouldii TaxID=260746 RepID=Q5I4C4_PECGU|nr:hypothetical protein [Pectinaria gouldii]